MKKEKKRELTIEQLRKKNKIANSIWEISLITIILTIVVSIIVAHYTSVNSYICAMFMLFYFVVFFIAAISADETQVKIIKKVRERKVARIKEDAKEGNLKGTIRIKDKDIMMSILANNIKTIEVKSLEEKNLVVDIYFSDNLCIQDVRISMEHLLERMNEDERESVLYELIDNIKIENLEERNKKVIIDGVGFCHEYAQITDENLLELFEY